MSEMGVTIAAIVLLLIVGLLAYAAAQPDAFRIARSAAIRAPAGTIFPLIDDFHAWTAWSPYEKLDPDMRKTYEGAPSGKGAIYAWEGKKAGAGRMEITEDATPNRVTIKLDFSKPFVAHNIAEFTLEPSGDATTVTWAMTGRRPFMMKVMGVFMNMDTMIGKDFEAGLASLKAATE
jgi:hypothetical protein